MLTKKSGNWFFILQIISSDQGDQNLYFPYSGLSLWKGSFCLFYCKSETIAVLETRVTHILFLCVFYIYPIFHSKIYQMLNAVSLPLPFWVLIVVSVIPVVRFQTNCLFRDVLYSLWNISKSMNGRSCRPLSWIIINWSTLNSIQFNWTQLSEEW